MPASRKIQYLLSRILLIGVLISISLVLIGGAMYLHDHAHETLHYELLHTGTFQLSPVLIVKNALSLTPLGIIEFGFIVLIATQILRIFLLTAFYFKIRDYWFTLFSAFILIILIYSFFWRNT